MTLSYKTYIQSNRWRQKRAEYKRHRPWMCFICGSTTDLHLHHKTYERLFFEELDDLIPLCATCHAALHELDGSLDPDDHFSVMRAIAWRAEKLRRALEREDEPKKLSEMTPEECKEYNRKIKNKEIRPRDWRSERQLPRKK